MKLRIAADQVVANSCASAERPGRVYYFADDQLLPSDFVKATDEASCRESLIQSGVTYACCSDTAVEVFADHRGWNQFYLLHEPGPPAQLIVSDSPFAFAGLCPVDWEVLKLVPLLGYVPLPLSPVEGTTRLKPGERAIFDRRTLRQTGSDSLLLTLLEPPDGPRQLNAVELARQVLRNATMARAPSADSPLVFLSGGFDSSLLVHLLQSIGTEPVAWTASFSTHLGERDGARAAAAAHHYGIPWTKVPVHALAVSEHLEGILNTMQEPFADVATIAEAVLARQAAKEHENPSVFEGEGMDSLMCGSYKFIAERYRRTLVPLLTLLPNGLLGSEDRASRVGSFGLKIRQLKEVLRGEGDVERHVRFLFSETERSGLLPEIEARVWDVFRSYYELLPAADPLTRLSCMTSLGIIPNLENRKLRLIERYADVRFELVYQDLDFVRLAFALSGKKKVSWGYGKHVVREAFSDELPRAVSGRAKLSFVFPVMDFFGADQLRELRETRLLDGDLVRRAIVDHSSGKVDHLKLLWGLHVANQWAKRYEEAGSRDPQNRE